MYAEKPADDEALRRKLWLRIAKHVIGARQNIKQVRHYASARLGQFGITSERPRFQFAQFQFAQFQFTQFQFGIIPDLIPDYQTRPEISYTHRHEHEKILVIFRR